MDLDKLQISILQNDKNDLIEHVKSIIEQHKSEIQTLQNTIKKKRKKLKKLRSQINTTDNHEIDDLNSTITQREQTIQELLTLRMFLRSSIEWIKQSVHEAFPKYNSFLYTAMLSNFGLVVTKGFYDFLLENVEGKQPTSSYWVPYLVWFIFGTIGWFVDRHVSKNGTLEKKLNAVRNATFGEISQREMRNAIGTGTVEDTLTKETEYGTLHPLGQDER